MNASRPWLFQAESKVISIIILLNGPPGFGIAKRKRVGSAIGVLNLNNAIG